MGRRGGSAAILRRRRLPAQAAASSLQHETSLVINPAPGAVRTFNVSKISPHNLSPRQKWRRPPSLGMALHHYGRRLVPLFTSARSCCCPVGSRPRARRSADG